MGPLTAIADHRPQIARVLLTVFAFCAWSLTGPANIALALLVVLFLWDVPGHWGRLRREPAFLLLTGGWLLCALLALRGAWLLPETAADQWRGISAWGAPLLFFPVAWWLRRGPEQVWDLLIAAPLGLALGVLRKTDWSLIPQVLEGMRYHFGYAALGLAFIAAVMLVGLLLLRGRIVRVRLHGRPRPLLGWGIWGGALAFAVALLAVTQSRGAALILAAAGTLYALGQASRRWRGTAPRSRPGPPQASRGLATAAFALAVAALLLWSTWGRQVEDWRKLSESDAPLSYTASATIRLNLLDVGLRAFAERPLLGFGPGTSTTEYLVPRGLVPVSAHHLAHAPAWSHLHSVPLEILVRFGLVGALVAVALIAVLYRAYRGLWSDRRTPRDLLAFLTLGAVMTLLFSVYDFRIVNIDQRFFFILFFGIVYGLHLAPMEPDPPGAGRGGDDD